MWRTELVNSKKQYRLLTVCYGLLLIIVINAFANTLLDNMSFIAVIVLILEWWKGCCYFKSIRGELALFYPQNELYWHRQRWLIVKTPLFFRYGVIIHLVSRRNAKKRVLFLMDDSFSTEDWRSLHYFLRYIAATP